MKIACAVFVLFAFMAAVASADSVTVSPDDAHLVYVGRWDTHDAKAPVCEWSNSMVRLHFHGTGASVKLNDGGNIYLLAVVDGKPGEAFHPDRGETTTVAAKDLPDADHILEIVRLTEANQGTTAFLGFELSAGATLLEPVKRPHLIEIVGDSISCGYGNLGKSEKEHYSPATQNGWLTYGAIASRHFDADFNCIAWSGRKLWPNNTMPEVYDLILPTDAKSKCDFATMRHPDVLLVNLGTNDNFGANSPDETKWTTAYETFIKHLRQNNPDAMIYVASGPMMYGDGLKKLKTYLAKIVSDCKAGGETKIAEVDFAQQGMQNGLGSDWHPNLKTHGIMAQVLEAAIAKDMQWKALADADENSDQASAAAAQPAAEIVTVWDGDTANQGGSWTTPQADAVSVKPDGEGHKGKKSLQFKASGSEYIGFGWNWVGWFPPDAGTDVSGCDRLRFYLKVTGDTPPDDFTVRLGSNNKKTSKALSVDDYAVDKESAKVNDGQWHEIVVPLKDLSGDFDPKGAWEFDLGEWSKANVSFTALIDSIQFLPASAKTSESAPKN